MKRRATYIVTWLLLQVPVVRVPRDVVPGVALPAPDVVAERVDRGPLVEPDDHVRVVDRLDRSRVGGRALFEVERRAAFVDGFVDVGALEARVVVTDAVVRGARDL